MDEYYRAVQTLPAWLARPLSALPPDIAEQVHEIRLRVGCGVQLTIGGRPCCPAGLTALQTLRLTPLQMEEIFLTLCSGSVHSHETEIAAGYVTLGCGCRAGLAITDIAHNYIDWNGVPYCPISEGNHEKYVLSEGDVVVARTGATVGYAKMVGRNIPDSVFASFLVRIRPIDDEYRYYFGLAITSAEFLNFVQTNAGGSAQPQANPPLLGEFELSIPNKQSLPEFNTKISSFLGVIESNETEISKLHEVKDTMVKMLSSR